MDARSAIWIRRWYWSGAALILLTLVVGGITRLTGSGLSMVEWRPLLGVLPPLNETQWLDVFDRYRQYPEYQQLNRGMSLAEFQFIFFWEYLHRMMGRLIGLVFLIPYAWFLWTGALNRREIGRATVLLAVGLGQGVMGWYMVQSGLADVPWVSHYRLGAHLVLAFLLFGCCVWFARDLTPIRGKYDDRKGSLQPWLWGFLVLLGIQILWGAFVAGLHAGGIYNTFPLMHGEWIPPVMWQMNPAVTNLVDNPAAVQWVHRWLGILIALGSLGLWPAVRKREAKTRRWGAVVLLVVFAQVALGIATLLYHVPVTLAVLHQAVAMVLAGLVIAWIHYDRNRIAAGSGAFPQTSSPAGEDVTIPAYGHKSVLSGHRDHVSVVNIDRSQ